MANRSKTTERNRTSQPDVLHLTQCNLVLCAVVELGCSRRLMAGHLLSVLAPGQQAAFSAKKVGNNPPPVPPWAVPTIPTKLPSKVANSLTNQRTPHRLC